MDALLITKDLMFSSRVKSIAARSELDLAVRARCDAAAEAIKSGTLKLLMVDLETPDCQIEEWVKLADSQSDPNLPDRVKTKIVAYAPHGQVDRIKNARAAGCDVVLTRGQFDSRIEELLGLAASS